MKRHSFAMRLGACGALATLLVGCATAPQRPENEMMARPSAAPVQAGADWAWVVSGDNAIRPIQVFTLDGKTYLQMRPGQIVPAVLVNSQPVSFTINAPYLVVQGAPARIDLISSGYRAVLLHRGPVSAPVAPSRDRVQRVDGDDASTQTYPMSSDADLATREVVRQAPPAATNTLPTMVVTASEARSRVWRIEPDQHLLSRALTDWASRAGMRVVWNSRVDVPITGPAEYRDGSFIAAMSHALADASGDGYRFYYSMNDSDHTVTVIALRS